MAAKEYSYSTSRLDTYLEESGIPEGWEELFTRRDIVSELKKISDQLEIDGKENVIYPDFLDIFKVFNLMKPEEARVILIGQDPYHDGSATGLCFEVPPRKVLNPSFKNIVKELTSEGFACEPGSGCLRPWLQQGVFLYNMGLTVIEHTPKSHSKLWENFSHEVIKYVSRINKNLVFILLGRDAQNIEPFISCHATHWILSTSHPSPFSASNGFLGSDIFNRCNKCLLKVTDNPIDFSIKKWC